MFDKLIDKYECFHLKTPLIDIMGFIPSLEEAPNDDTWYFTKKDNCIFINNAVSSVVPGHYNSINIPLLVNGYPPDESDYIWEVGEGIEYEDAETFYLRHKNSGEEILRIEFFN